MALETLVSGMNGRFTQVSVAYRRQHEKGLIFKKTANIQREDDTGENSFRLLQLELIHKAYKKMLWEHHVSTRLRMYGASSYVPGQYLNVRI